MCQNKEHTNTIMRPNKILSAPFYNKLNCVPQTVHKTELLLSSSIAIKVYCWLNLLMLCNIITIPLSVHTFNTMKIVGGINDNNGGSNGGGGSSNINHQQHLLGGNSGGNSGGASAGNSVVGNNNINNNNNKISMNSPLAAAWTNANLNKQAAVVQQNKQTASSNNKLLQQATPEDDEYPNPNINNAGHTITKILTAFFEHGYDKRVRPNYSGPPAMVNVSFHIIGISSVNEVQMDFTTDFYFRQKWYDPRLMFEPIGEIKELCVGAEFAEKIWLPDTFFANEKTATFHRATTDNTFIRIAHNGRVYRSIRLTVTCSCPMDLQYFPMDRQRCKIEIESYGYNTRDIDYRWEKGNESVSLDTKIELPQFKILGHRMGHELQNLSSGDYIRLYCEIHFVRSMGYYLIQIYIPASLIVIISWVSFWLHRNATPARVALGVTTVLTMTTLMSSTNAALPKISYVKSIDVFLGTCFVMVFASLLEYASVGYVGKRISMKSKRQQDLQRLHQHHQKVCVAAAATAAAAQATQTLNANTANQQTPKLGFLGRVGNNINSNANYIFSSNKQSGGLVNNNNNNTTNQQQPINYPTAQPPPVQQQSVYYRNQQQQQLQHQHQPPTQTQTLQRRFTTTSAHHNGSQYATSSQPVSVRRLMPDSEPIYGQRSSIKVCHVVFHLITYY